MKIAFSPSVYEHAAFLIGMTPWDVSHDAELLWRAHRTAYEMYHHSPIVVGIDIYNVEAEAYGCIVDRPSGNGIPAVTRGILDSVAEARALKPFDPEVDGRIGMIIGVGKRLAEEFTDADVRVPVSGPFSIAVSLRTLGGLLEDVAFAPEEVARFLKQLVEGQICLCQAVIEVPLPALRRRSSASASRVRVCGCPRFLFRSALALWWTCRRRPARPSKRTVRPAGRSTRACRA